MRSRSRRSRRGNRILALLLLSVLCFSLPLLPQNGGQQSKRELEKKKKRINDEIRQLNAQLNHTKNSRKNSMGALLSINVKLKKRQELIRMINLEMAMLDKDIEKSEIQAGQLKTSLRKLKEEYARMIQYSQRNQDSYTALMFVFASDNFNQALQRVRYIQQYAEFRRRQAAEITHTQNALQTKLAELKEQQNQKLGLLGTERQQQNTLSNEKKQQEKVLTELQVKEKELKKELQKKKDDAVQLQLAIKRMIEEEIRRKAEESRKREEARRLAALAKENKEREDRKKKPREAGGTKTVADVKPEKKETLVPELNEEALALSADFSNNRGRLPWPVSRGVICEQYGEHEHPAIKGFMMFNNGIEICCNQGTQARAVFEGEVTGIAISPAGGKLVIIRHGQYLSVYSNLDNVLVKTGQKISVKQPIGTVLYDGDEGKSSLGFQIWKEQKTMDPGGWLANGR